MSTDTSTEAGEDQRASLTSRVIPIMTLSEGLSPLTRPLDPLPFASARTRAEARFQVHGKAIVTGGAGALGLVSAQALLEHGLSLLCIMDLPKTLETSEEQIQSLVSKFPSANITKIPLDVTSMESIEAAFEQANKTMGGIDILCCFAGIPGCQPSLTVTPDQVNRVMDVNLNGSFFCAQAAAKLMESSGKGGCILFTASISAHYTNFPQPQAAYNASKAAVAHLTRNLAAEWAVYGIRVNSISPGYMDTILNAGDGLADIRKIWDSRCPMGRMGDPEEITGAVVLLCSRRAGRYITGADIVIDGGTLTL
ncbi:Short-chain dehydrogenase/reductase SDR [Penicillium cf. griseofulvum]|uniref:D-arabinitol 2-dehydrogenase [ribulose-forming] n=1 Tax=Penicillium cf. griseofulvum TaxID=2972120 RepID=A0A9W9MS26_9EURO|nr:Short-chain dehydrogenase/reductase SDR [Penicillium cf. griseofulvum]KAJ5440605.1 Short-chain dehydrogenase/reductase SDR [Penicillium cf. griseofulvum]KAJ5448655.1 Short-chain dehydrogenase/reductase SDR [Penicillium cf. griseofulvum]